eukprot:scaffold73613_cov40-Phaeocystis_antarctica.AAC.1
MAGCDSALSVCHLSPRGTVFQMVICTSRAWSRLCRLDLARVRNGAHARATRLESRLRAMEGRRRRGGLGWFGEGVSDEGDLRVIRWRRAGIDGVAWSAAGEMLVLGGGD